MSLNLKEKSVMRAILQECKNNKACLIATQDLYRAVASANKQGKEKDLVKPEEMDGILQVLELDDYFDVVRTEKKGEPTLCITLHAKGKSFEREEEQHRRYLRFKVALTVGLAVLSFVIGRILVAIFS